MLSQAYVNDAKTPFCADALPSLQEEDVYAYSRYRKSDKLAKRPGLRKSRKQVEQFNCYRFKDVDPRKDSDLAGVTRHLQAGFALSDLYCDTFFRRIALHSNGRRFIRNGANDVGAAVSAALGLAAAGSAVTGGVGAGFGLLDAEIRSYDDAFLVAADLPGLREAVTEAQFKYRDKIKADKPDNYADATTSIIRYAHYCSWVGMRGLITEKLKGEPRDPELFAKEVKQFLDNADKIKKMSGPAPAPTPTPTPTPAPAPTPAPLGNPAPL